jgi:prepilin-type N-terminal cleavage/methylation domain-containing protein
MKWDASSFLGRKRLPSIAVDCRRLQSHGLPPTAYSLQPTACRGAASGRRGFTLVEILVATSILMVIVLKVSMVFQQSNGAFQGGLRRVKDQTVLRGILGAIARELMLAVPITEEEYPGLADEVAFSSQTDIAFVALSGDLDTAAKRRAPQWINFYYEGGEVKRAVADITYKDGEWTVGGETQTVLNPDHKLLDFEFSAVWAPGESAAAGHLPLRIDILAKLETSGKDWMVSAKSAGADREWDTKDDVEVGGR